MANALSISVYLSAYFSRDGGSLHECEHEHWMMALFCECVCMYSYNVHALVRWLRMNVFYHYAAV